MSNASFDPEGQCDYLEDAMAYYHQLDKVSCFLTRWEINFMEERVELDELGKLPPYSSLSWKQQRAVDEILEKLYQCESFEHALAKDD